MQRKRGRIIKLISRVGKFQLTHGEERSFPFNVLERLRENTPFFSNANFCLPQSFVGAKNCKSGELIRQNVTEQQYFAPREI